jgi:hypothetical protein
MAVTTGLVHRLTWTGTVVCAWVGPSLSSAEIFVITFGASDSEQARGFKRSMAYLLGQAQISGYQISVNHPDSSAEITSLTSVNFDICPISMAIHNDFYSISGTDIPDDTEVVFDSPTLTVTVTPDLIRPHLVVIAELPATIPTGRNTVRLQAPGWSSDAVLIDVFSSPQATVRVLYSGAPKSAPYTIAFVANPAIEAAGGGSFSADPVLSNRAGFHTAVGYCLRNLLTVTEDLLYQDNLDAHIRFVSIFDPTLGASDANALAHELSPNLMETRRSKLNAFLARYGEKGDMVFVVHGSTTHTRATAWYTTDDASQPGTAFTYDGVARMHRHFASIPGSAAIPISVNQSGLTAIHEFGHGASDFNNGRVNDLYVDSGTGGFVVNKKARTSSGAPIPANFGTYNAMTYMSDQNRDELGYPSSWTSYHPELIDPTRPNMMDNYWLAFDDPLRCRLDRLTYHWFSDRLRAKIFR